MNANASGRWVRLTPVARAVAAIVAIVAWTLPSAAGPAGPPAEFIVDGGRAKPTRAWIKFCQEAPTECAVGPFEVRSIPHSDQVWNDLVSVNSMVNKSIRAVTDMDQWGVSDRWDYPTTGAGDCEDIQIEKRRRLAALGYSLRAMRMAVVVNPEGEGHAVLVVRTSSGDFVLDNRVDEVLPWYSAPYVWVKRESDDGSLNWVALGGVRSPVETAGDTK